MRRQSGTRGGQPTRNNLPGLPGDLGWLLLVTLAVIVTALLNGPAAGAGLLRASEDRSAAPVQASAHPSYAAGHIDFAPGDDGTGRGPI